MSQAALIFAYYESIQKNLPTVFDQPFANRRLKLRITVDVMIERSFKKAIKALAR